VIKGISGAGGAGFQLGNQSRRCYRRRRCGKPPLNTRTPTFVCGGVIGTHLLQEFLPAQFAFFVAVAATASVHKVMLRR
jgi:hypothetical protein